MGEYAWDEALRQAREGPCAQILLALHDPGLRLALQDPPAHYGQVRAFTAIESNKTSISESRARALGYPQ